jgi:hypothetical protein
MFSNLARYTLIIQKVVLTIRTTRKAHGAWRTPLRWPGGRSIQGSEGGKKIGNGCSDLGIDFQNVVRTMLLTGGRLKTSAMAFGLESWPKVALLPCFVHSSLVERSASSKASVPIVLSLSLPDCFLHL